MLPRCIVTTPYARFLLITLISNVWCGPRYSSRIVEIETGAIRGIILELNSHHLEPVEVFKGVPYAAPPVGPLRFKPPQSPLPWPGTRLADTFGPVCPQKQPDIVNRTAALSSMPIGRYNYLKKLLPILANQSEDCLFLNIYIPGSGNRGFEAPYAVLVFVHGESFNWGGGHPYDGSVLASYGHIIVITLNFRIGILGFLRTRPVAKKTDTENLGIKDIAAALRWIKSNIAAFGGDPKRITLMGHGTGAALANLLFISRSTKGLLKRVVLLSGTALSPWAVINNPDNLLTTVGHQTGCISLKASANEEDEDIAPCLRSRPLEALLNIKLEKITFLPTIGPSLPIEGDITDPTYTMEHTSENFITCELMLGVTTTESYTDFNADDILYGFEEDKRGKLLRTFVRNTYVYHLNEIFSAIKNEYTDWDKPIQHPINIRDSVMEALSDGHTVSPLIRVAYLHARRGAKTYFFHFAYQTKDSEYPQRLGSIKGEDLSYLLGLPLVGGMPYFPQNYTKQDMGVSEASINFLVNFVKNGDPNNAGPHIPDYGTFREKSRYKNIVWENYETSTQYYLSLTSKPRIKSHYRGHKMAVWLNLIPQLHQPGDADVSMRHHHFHEREPHYYAGVVRPETFTRIPIPLHPASASHNHQLEDSECVTNTSDEVLAKETPINGLNEEEDSEDILEKLSIRSYNSYTAALGITVGVGCLLLILNMLIFIGIYYQRDHNRRTQENRLLCSNFLPLAETCSTTSKRHSINSSAYQSPFTNRNPAESPQAYHPTINKKDDKTQLKNTEKSNEGLVKKRVHMQEICV